MTLPDAPEPFRAASWAWYELASAAEAMPGTAMTAMPTAMDGAASSRDFFMLSSWNGVAGDPACRESSNAVLRAFDARRHIGLPAIRKGPGRGAAARGPDEETRQWRSAARRLRNHQTRPAMRTTPRTTRAASRPTAFSTRARAPPVQVTVRTASAGDRALGALTVSDSRTFWEFAAWAGLATAGLVTFGVISHHLVTGGLVPTAAVPLVYAAAMAAEAVPALVGVVGVLQLAALV